MAESEARWYVAHTYSGYENKVKADIEKTIKNRGLQDQILEVHVPMLNIEKDADEGKKLVQQKMFPAYVLINMIMNDETWYVVRNTRGVTGFVGPGSKPVPLTEAEMANMGLAADGISTPSVPFSIGDEVNIIEGVWEGSKGIVRNIDHDNKTVEITIDLFGRETPVEISFDDVKVVE